MSAPEEKPIEGRPAAIELPAPTVWPMVLALGVTLAFGGLVTNAIVSILGLVLALIGGIGWWRQVLPTQQHEAVVLRSTALRAKPVVASRAAVRRLIPGEDGHRVRIPTEVQPISAGIKGGIFGGAAMAIGALVYGVACQQSLAHPVKLLSALAMPQLTHADMATLRSFHLTAPRRRLLTHACIA